MNLLHLVSLLIREGINVTSAVGTDFSPVLIETAKREAKSCLPEGELRKFEFHVAKTESIMSDLSTAARIERSSLENSFHFVLGVNTIRYCHAAKTEMDSVRAIFNLLAPGGICVVIDMNNRFPFFRSELKNLLRWKKKLEIALKDWRTGRAPGVRIPPAPTIEKRKIVLVDKPGAPQSSIRVGFVGVRRADPDYFPILLMNQIFGGSFYRLDMNLRERQQWTYGARSAFDMRRTPGPASAGGEFVAAHTADAVAEILKERRIMATTEVTDEELARAKDNFAKSFPARFATRGSTAGLLGELSVYGLPDTFPATYTKNIQAVTKSEIRRVAQKFLLSDKMVIVVVGDRAG
jgi:SAM-dependent methyltransferase